MSVLRESTDSERRSPRWDQKAGFGNYFVLVVGHGWSAVLALSALWLASRAIGTSGYGRIVAVIAASQLVGQFAIQWSAIALFRHGCEEFVAKGSIASSFWNRLFILSASLTLVICSAPLWMPPLIRWLALPQGSVVILVALLASTALAAHVQQSLNAAKLPRFQAVLQLTEKVFLVVALTALTTVGHTSWWSVASAFALAPVIAASVGLVRLRKLILPVARPDSTLIRQMLRFSLPLIVYSIVGYLTTNHVDAFFILEFLSVTALGIYALSYQLAGSFMQIPSLAGSLLMAWFITTEARGRPDSLSRFFATTLPVLTLLWSVGCALAAVAGSVLVTWFFEATFYPARELLWPLMAAAAFTAPVTIGFGPLANARSKTTIPAVAAGAAALMNIGLNFVLVPRFGLTGCAWATAAAFAVSFLLCAHLVWRLEGVPVRPAVFATTPALAGAIVAHFSDGPSGLIAAGATAMVIALLRRDSIREAISGAERIPFMGQAPRPEVSK